MSVSTSGYCNSCPEAPNSVTITSTTVTIDGGAVVPAVETFTIGAGTITTDSLGAYTRIALADYPISPASLTLYKNGVAQRLGVTLDFTLIGKTVVLADAAVVSDSFMASYWASTLAPTGVMDTAVGFLMGFDYGSDLANVPAGWLALDGVTSYARVTYPALYTFANAHGYLLSSTATHFVLKLLTAPLYDGTTLVQAPAIIKY